VRAKATPSRCGGQEDADARLSRHEQAGRPQTAARVVAEEHRLLQVHGPTAQPGGPHGEARPVGAGQQGRHGTIGVDAGDEEERVGAGATLLARSAEPRAGLDQGAERLGDALLLHLGGQRERPTRAELDDHVEGQLEAGGRDLSLFEARHGTSSGGPAGSSSFDPARTHGPGSDVLGTGRIGTFAPGRLERPGRP
jgi:hypothetical protein